MRKIKAISEKVSKILKSDKQKAIRNQKAIKRPRLISNLLFFNIVAQTTG